MKYTLIHLFLFIPVQLVFSQDQTLIKYANTITKDDLKNHLSIIAADSLEGRNTGDIGLEKAARYIENEFIGDSLIGPVTPSINNYYQEFELEKKIWIKKEFSTGSTTLNEGNDLYFIGIPAGIHEYELVFAGYGLYSENYNDYKNIDVKDKLVAFIEGEPQKKNGNYLMSGTDKRILTLDSTLNSKLVAMQTKAFASIIRGAKGFMLIGQDDKEAKKTIRELKKAFGDVQMNIKGKENWMNFVSMIYCSPSTASEIFGTSKKKFDNTIKEKIEKSESPAGLFNASVKIEAIQKTEIVKTGNIIAMIEGSDKKEEYLVISAHYDHLGVIKGDIYNGADDNGTGTAALIELAEAFSLAKSDGNGPRRSILFIALSGEEKGLLGSEYYTENPVVPLANTVADINIDMIGRIDKEHQTGNYIYMLGSDKLSGVLHKINEKTAKIYFPDFELNYAYNSENHPEMMNSRSDHYHFAEKGIPAIFYFSGLHKDYHTPDDDVEKIDFESYQQRARLIFATAWQIANSDEMVK